MRQCTDTVQISVLEQHTAANPDRMQFKIDIKPTYIFSIPSLAENLSWKNIFQIVKLQTFTLSVF